MGSTSESIRNRISPDGSVSRAEKGSWVASMPEPYQDTLQRLSAESGPCRHERIARSTSHRCPTPVSGVRERRAQAGGHRLRGAGVVAGVRRAADPAPQDDGGDV